jgi:hypothetical protein
MIELTLMGSERKFHYRFCAEDEQVFVLTTDQPIPHLEIGRVIWFVDRRGKEQPFYIVDMHLDMTEPEKYMNVVVQMRYYHGTAREVAPHAIASTGIAAPSSAKR